jgi:hypothetical protein
VPLATIVSSLELPVEPVIGWSGTAVENVGAAVPVTDARLDVEK